MAQQRTRRRAPASRGVLTAARVFLLGEVWRGRVAWVVPGGPALRYPRTGDDRRPVDVTQLFGEVMRSGWAAITPWDSDNPPGSTPCVTTEKGDDALLSAQARRMRRAARRRSVPARPAPAARRVTYRPVVLRELHAARQWLRRHWAARRRRVGAAVRAWPGQLAAALRRWIVAERIGGHYRRAKPRTRTKGRNR